MILQFPRQQSGIKLVQTHVRNLRATGGCITPDLVQELSCSVGIPIAILDKILKQNLK